MASVLSFIALLALAGALLHLVWYLVLAVLIWAPSAAGALAVGWYVVIWTDNAFLGIAVAILAATMIRACVARALAWLWLRTIGGMPLR